MSTAQADNQLLYPPFSMNKILVLYEVDVWVGDDRKRLFQLVLSELLAYQLKNIYCLSHRVSCIVFIRTKTSCFADRLSKDPISHRFLQDNQRDKEQQTLLK